MSKKIFLDTFYKQFFDFLTELDKMYPNDSDFSTFSTKLSVLKTVNPMLPIQFIKTEIIEKEKLINANCDISPDAIEMFNKSVTNPELIAPAGEAK